MVTMWVNVRQHRELAVAAAFGGGALRRRYASMTGQQLARGLVRVALAKGEPRKIVHAEALRV